MRSLSLALLLLAALFVVLARTERPLDRPFAECRAAPTADCILDLGIQRALDSSRQLRAVHAEQLAWLGRFDAAETLIAFQEQDRGKTETEAAAWAAWRVAPHRLLTALRAGQDLEDALAAVPAADGSSLSLAALELLSEDPFGARPPAPAPLPPDKRRELVLALASQIEEWVAAGSPRGAPRHLEDAAELRARLGDRSGVRELLHIMRESGVDLYPSPVLARVAGAEALVAYADPGDDQYPHLVERAAVVEPDPTRAADLFERAFRIHAAREGWPDFDEMGEVVIRAAEAGLRDEAARLAQRMARLADADDSPFQLFHRIDAARALLETGAPRAEVLARLDGIEAEFPDELGTPVAFGIVGGLYTWGEYADDARSQVAGLALRLGDTARAIRMAEGTKDPARGWDTFAHDHPPLPILATLLERAERLLPPSAAAMVASQLALQAASDDATAEHRAWALERARELLDRRAFLEEDAGWVLERVARVAVAAGDEDLARQALEALVASALDRREAAELVRAGFLLRSAEGTW